MDCKKSLVLPRCERLPIQTGRTKNNLSYTVYKLDGKEVCDNLPGWNNIDQLISSVFQLIYIC